MIVVRSQESFQQTVERATVKDFTPKKEIDMDFLDYVLVFVLIAVGVLVVVIIVGLLIAIFQETGGVTELCLTSLAESL